jgi:hypothetical protein
LRHDGIDINTTKPTSTAINHFTPLVWPVGATVIDMCRNITELRGLEPPATEQEIRAAAEQFVRKVSGVPKPPTAVAARYAAAIDAIATEMTSLLSELPARRQPPLVDPPLRRLAAKAAGADPSTLRGPRLRPRS